MWWEAAVGVLAGLVVFYLALLTLLWTYSHRHPDTVSMRDALHLLPDVIRLVKRLATDSTLPRRLRVWLALLLLYLLSPIDIVPDFVPVIGWADDAVVVALVLRAVVKRAGPEALARHWPGTPQTLAVMRQLAGVAP